MSSTASKALCMLVGLFYFYSRSLLQLKTFSKAKSEAPRPIVCCTMCLRKQPRTSRTHPLCTRFSHHVLVYELCEHNWYYCKECEPGLIFTSHTALASV